MAELAPAPIRADISGTDIAVRTAALAGQWIVTGRSVQANTIEAGPPTVIWLAPDRVLVAAETATSPPGGDFVTDVTDGLVVLDITGANARALLEMASPLDPAALAPGNSAQTLFAGIKVIIYPHRDGLRLHVERALAEWLVAWIAQAVTTFAQGSPGEK
jgi:heterotetrameric sarcosine oxidase gamma subunit